MKPNCEVCGSENPVAEMVTPAIGEYSACQPCMDAGTRPPCHQACGRASEFVHAGMRWCTQCHDAEREARALLADSRREKLVAAAEAQLNARIRAGIEEALKLRGI